MPENIVLLLCLDFLYWAVLQLSLGNRSLCADTWEFVPQSPNLIYPKSEELWKTNVGEILKPTSSLAEINFGKIQTIALLIGSGWWLDSIWYHIGAQFLSCSFWHLSAVNWLILTPLAQQTFSEELLLEASAELNMPKIQKAECLGYFSLLTEKKNTQCQKLRKQRFI